VKEHLKRLEQLGLYINIDKVNALRYIRFNDGSELYLIYFDKYVMNVKPTIDDRISVKIYPIHDKPQKKQYKKEEYNDEDIDFT